MCVPFQDLHFSCLRAEESRKNPINLWKDNESCLPTTVRVHTHPIQSSKVQYTAPYNVPVLFCPYTVHLIPYFLISVLFYAGSKKPNNRWAGRREMREVKQWENIYLP